jgi:hypothetical protein
MGLVGRLFGRRKLKQRSADGSRPVKLVPDGVNSWRAVWAD